MAILSYLLTIDTDTCEFTVKDTESNVSQSVSLPIKRSAKKVQPVVEESNEPQVILSSNKYTLNSAAVKMMGVNIGDKINIAFDSIGKPVIGTTDAFGTGTGNKLTSTYSVSYRGNNNTELAKYGDVFSLKEKGNGLYYLIGNNDPEPIQMDENLKVPAEGGISNVPDINFDDLMEDIKEDPESQFTMSGFDFSF